MHFAEVLWGRLLPTGFRSAPRSLRLAILPLMLVVAGCNASDGGGGGGTADWATDGVTFNPAQATQYLDSTEFNNVNADCVFLNCGASGPLAPLNQANPYELIKLHLAHSALIGEIPLDGAGQLVAVVDDGILQSHREFDAAGKLTIFGVVPERDHGTHVASLVGGLRDGAAVTDNMHGVAPGADLHMTSWNPSGADPNQFALDNITAGTLDAAGLGAVAQNNSWGFEVSANEWNNNTVGTIAARLNNILGYGTVNWQGYIDALDTFQETGVIVWAMANDEGLANGSVLATLPYFESSLAEAWITAVNGYFEVNGSGDITYAERLSAPCGYAATFCIAGDGTTFGADATANDGYSAGTGTSYVAPQVAGSIALLAQAFPDLTPEEWTKRLLASADSSWFLSQSISVDGTVDFGGGITRGYSDEWGLGTIDLEAALSPIGAVSVLSGTTVANADRTLLNSSYIVTAGAFGDALVQALDGREMAVFDHFNGNFTMDAGQLVQLRPQAAIAGVFGEVGVMTGRRAGNSAVTFGGLLTMSDGAGGVLQRAAGTNVISQASVLSMATNVNLVTAGTDEGPVALSFYGFAGGHRVGGSQMMAGLGVDASVEALGGTITLGVSQSFEQGALLGLVGNDAFNFGAGSSISAAHVGYTRALGDNLSMFGNIELGIAGALGFTDGSLVEAVGPMTFSGYNIGATATNVLVGDDSFTFSLTRPTTVTSGEVAVAIPVGRTAEGGILVETLAIDLAPTGRQRDLGLNYAFGVGDAGRLSFAAQYSLDAGNVAGARGLAFAVGYGFGF
ncbi:MAG: S8 family peptidase [Alphaproteobacteria bacterium]